MASGTSGDGRRAVRRAIDDRELVQMALHRFSLEYGTRFPRLAETAAHFHRDPAVVSRNVFLAFKRGLVEVREAPVLVNRLTTLEAELYRRFDKLRHVMVVDAVYDGSNASGDKVHEQLGAAMADHLTGGEMFRDGDHIGVGSGRGVWETVQALRENAEPFRFQDIKLVSLSGASEVHHYRESRRTHLDADHVCLQLGYCFEQADPQLVKRRLLPKSGDEPKRFRAQVDFAILGVGVLRAGHRLREIYQSGELKGDIRKRVGELCAASDRFHTADYCPVADLGHAFFIVDPPPDSELEIGERDMQRLTRAADALNEMLAAPTKRSYERMPSLAIVAGTSPKAPAILALLERSKCRVHRLCTDRVVAEKLLAWSDR